MEFKSVAGNRQRQNLTSAIQPIQPSTVSVPPPPAFLHSARSSQMSSQQSEYEDVPLSTDR